MANTYHGGGPFIPPWPTNGGSGSGRQWMQDFHTKYMTGGTFGVAGINNAIIPYLMIEESGAPSNKCNININTTMHPDFDGGDIHWDLYFFMGPDAATSIPFEYGMTGTAPGEVWTRFYYRGTFDLVTDGTMDKIIKVTVTPLKQGTINNDCILYFRAGRKDHGTIDPRIVNVRVRYGLK